MLVFIDESGDPGLKIDAGSSKYFVVALIVVIDEMGSENFKSELKRYIVRRLNDDSGKCFIKKVRTQDSRKNNLVQLADMVGGAVARSFSGKKDSREYRSLIARHEMNVELWPK